MVINVMGVPGNGQFQPEGGLPQIPQFTLSMDEGFALRDRLDKGEKVEVSFRLEVPELRNVATEYTIATLPGTSDEQIVVMTHTDGYFQAAMDNAAGMATQAGFANCYNVLEGFEGDRDANGHRNTVGGWRAAGLPWVQG